jgi:lipoprotein signal peptidase
VRGQQKEFETTRQIDYPIAGLISAVALGVAMYLLGFLGWWGIFIAPVVGGGAADIVHRAVGRRRSRYLPLAAVIGGAIGILPSLWRPLTRFFGDFVTGELGAVGSGLLEVFVPMVVGGLILSTLYYRLRGIRL